MRITRRSFAALTAGVAVGGLTLSRQAIAQSAPIKVIFPFAAGGPGDATARFCADKIAAAMNRAGIVENRTGADGRIGIQAVKAAPPDGTTFLVTTGPTMALMPQIHKAAGYDPEADFEPVSHLSRFEFCLVVANTTPAKTVAELASWCKANPDKATYAVPGLGTIPHFAGVAFGKLVGSELRRLAYRGGTPAMNDLVGGQVPIGFMTLSDALQQHLAGGVRMLAVLSKARSPFVPDIPTMIEAGYAIDGEAWYGLWAPAGTPKDLIAAANKAIVDGLAAPDVKDRFMKMGLIPTGTSPAELARIRRALADDWAPTIKASGFTLEQ